MLWRSCSFSWRSTSVDEKGFDDNPASSADSSKSESRHFLVLISLMRDRALTAWRTLCWPRSHSCKHRSAIMIGRLLNISKLTLIIVEFSSSLPAKMILTSLGSIPNFGPTNSFTLSMSQCGSSSTLIDFPFVVFTNTESLLEIFFFPKLNNSNIVWIKSLKKLKIKLIKMVCVRKEQQVLICVISQFNFYPQNDNKSQLTALKNQNSLIFALKKVKIPRGAHNETQFESNRLNGKNVEHELNENSFIIKIKRLSQQATFDWHQVPVDKTRLVTQKKNNWIDDFLDLSKSS